MSSCYVDVDAGYCEYGFLCLFIVEALIKMYGLGFSLYFRSSFNKFDCVVSCKSSIKMVVVCIVYSNIDACSDLFDSSS